MKKVIKKIFQSFKKRPIWTTYSLILAPIYYLMVLLTALVIAAINLDVGSGVTFWKENT